MTIVGGRASSCALIGSGPSPGADRCSSVSPRHSRTCSPRARFRLTEVFFGLLPAMILPCIARRVGEVRAFRMALLAEDVDAREAVGIGLADTLAEDSEVRLRRTLSALGRTDAATVAELKTSRNLLFPEDTQYALHAQRLLGRRLSDP